MFTEAQVAEKHKSNEFASCGRLTWGICSDVIIQGRAGLSDRLLELTESTTRMTAEVRTSTMFHRVPTWRIFLILCSTFRFAQATFSSVTVYSSLTWIQLRDYKRIATDSHRFFGQGNCLEFIKLLLKSNRTWRGSKPCAKNYVYWYYHHHHRSGLSPTDRCVSLRVARCHRKNEYVRTGSGLTQAEKKGMP